MNNMASSKPSSGSQKSAENDTSVSSETANFHENKVKKSNLNFPSKKGRKFIGVRQRASGRWVAEIKDSSQKLRLWLGTYDKPEEAAMAYDSAARLLRGRNAKTNFTYPGIKATPEENCSLLGKNPRLYTLLKHAIMKNLAKSSSSVDASEISWKDENIISSSSNEDDHRLCKLSHGSSKVYSSVVVAPSFSAAVSDQGKEEESYINDHMAQSFDALFYHSNGLYNHELM